MALRSIARRIADLNEEITALDAELDRLVALAAPTTITGLGIGPAHAATLLVAAGQNIERLTSEASFTHLCGVAPIPASSGPCLLGPHDPPPAQLQRHSPSQPVARSPIAKTIATRIARSRTDRRPRRRPPEGRTDSREGSGPCETNRRAVGLTIAVRPSSALRGQSTIATFECKT